MINFTKSDFAEVLKESYRLKEENTMNYFALVLSFIRKHHGISYDFDKICEINSQIIDKNNHSPNLKKFQFDYFEGDTLEHFMSTSVESSIKSIKHERPKDRTLGISIDEQHLLVNFLDVYSLLLKERKRLDKKDDSKVDFKGIMVSDDGLKKQRDDLKDRINSNPIEI